MFTWGESLLPTSISFFHCRNDSGYCAVCRIMLDRLDFESVLVSIYCIYLVCLLVYVLGVEGEFQGGGKTKHVAMPHYSLVGLGTERVCALIRKLCRDRRYSAPSIW